MNDPAAFFTSLKAIWLSYPINSGRVGKSMKNSTDTIFELEILAHKMGSKIPSPSFSITEQWVGDYLDRSGNSGVV